MKWLLLLALLPVSANAQTIPTWSQGSMQATTTSTQTIEETIAHEIYGGAVTTYSGTNVEPSTTITDTTSTFDVVDTAEPWQLEITTRAAGIIETIDIDRSIDVETTTTSLSVFSN